MEGVSASYAGARVPRTCWRAFTFSDEGVGEGREGDGRGGTERKKLMGNARRMGVPHEVSIGLERSPNVVSLGTCTIGRSHCAPLVLPFSSMLCPPAYQSYSTPRPRPPWSVSLFASPSRHHCRSRSPPQRLYSVGEGPDRSDSKRWGLSKANWRARERQWAGREQNGWC
ncbi:hypothetical protein CH063_04082, partial [Colletotrichum higginsianum]